MCGEITLLGPNPGPQNSIGVFTKGEPKRRKVLCRDGGISRSEWSTAGQNGHRPELMVAVAKADYHGEKEAEFDGVVYSIYRTYPKPKSFEVELYLEAKVGVSL